MPPAFYVTTQTGWLNNKLALVTTLSRATCTSKSCGLGLGRLIAALVWEVQVKELRFGRALQEVVPLGSSGASCLARDSAQEQSEGE